MPQLYLDFLENKDKVKPELRERLYEPKWDQYDPNFIQHLEISNEEVNNAAQDFRKTLEEFDPESKELGTLRFTSNFKERERRSNLVDSVMSDNFLKPHSEVVRDTNSPHGSFGKIKYEPESLPSSKSPSKFMSKHSPTLTKKFTVVDDVDDNFIVNDDPYSSIKPSEDRREDFKRDERRDEREDRRRSDRDDY